MSATLPQVRGWRATVATRIAVAEARGTDDPIAGRLDEHRACVAELDAWIADIQEHECDYCTECGCCDGEPLIDGLCQSLCSADRAVTATERNA